MLLRTRNIRSTGQAAKFAAVVFKAPVIQQSQAERVCDTLPSRAAERGGEQDSGSRSGY